MDPLSLSASIAGLVALADLVFRAATDYVKAAKGSQKEVNDLSREVKNLSCVLHNLSLVAFELEVNDEAQASTHQPSSALKPHHLHECQQLLRQLEEKLRDQNSQLNSSSGFERLRSRMKWPFTSAETKEILQTMRRQKETIDTALASDTLSKLMLCLSRQKESSAQVEKLQLTANKILDMQLESFRDTQKRSVLDYFSILNYRTEFETNLALRHPLTGLWLTEGQDFAEWHATLGSRIWFTGIPGAGKSVIAALVIQECLQRARTSPGTAVAFHYSVYRNQQTHQPQAVLSSLCVQLALQDANAFKELEEYHAELSMMDYLSRRPSIEGLTAVLRRMFLCFSRVYIIVDGVDECGDHAEETAKSLMDLTASQVEGNVSLAVLSRNEIGLRHIMDPGCHNVEIAAHTEDLQEYVATELNQRISSRKLRLKDLRLKDDIMTSLVKGAQGMFRWVACQLDHLCELPTDRARRAALLKLPPTLPATYERILLRIESYDEQVKRIVQRALLMIGSPQQDGSWRLGFREICELASIDESSEYLYEDEIVDEEEILRWCGSLVRTSDDGGTIEFAHFTVQEYLWNDCAKHDILKAYSISDETVGAVLGSLCIRYLMLKNHEQPVEATDDYIDIVMDAGAVPNSQVVTPFQTATFLHLAVSSSMYGDDLEIAADLVRVGVSIEEEDKVSFKSRYDHAMMLFEPDDFKAKFTGGKAIISLLEALHQYHHDGPSSAKMSLYALTLQLAKHMKLDISSQAYQLQLGDELSESYVKKYLLNIIETNDREGLLRFLQSGRSDLVRGVGIDAKQPSWTSLHLAVKSRAFEVLGKLLEAGLDPNVASYDCRTPVHLCCTYEDEPALRLLLKHGASTTTKDDEGRTIWHHSARANGVTILSVLIELGERDQGLESVSDDGDTPIAAALRCSNHDSLRLLLPYCSSERSWKCGESLYRAAARFGKSFIIQGMMEAQVETDGEDSVTGNPLHHLHINSSLECIGLFKKAFSVNERRSQDFRTPLESMLVRAVERDEEWRMSEGAVAELLPSNAIEDASEGSKIWSVVCEETVLQAMEESDAFGRHWFNQVLKELMTLGIPDLYEAHHQQSSVPPFIAAVSADFKYEYDRLLVKHQEPCSWYRERWRRFSVCFQQLAQDTRYLASAVEDPNMVRLLSLSVLQGDHQMTSLLLEKGVNIHARTDMISPFEFSCFPEVHISEDDFDHLLSFATKGDMEWCVASLHGCGPLHFVAGFESEREASVPKLSKLLQIGMDCNQPLSPRYGSPLTHHIEQRALKTAEALLQHGADPWAIGPRWMTPALMATQMGDVSLLQMMAAASEGKDDSLWGQEWTRRVSCGCMTGGNALHLAAFYGQTDCISFYLEQGLLSDLEAGENDLGTPLHHAAHYGHHDTIAMLEGQGANVNTKDKLGQTPLHVAVLHEHVRTVEVLLRLGATHQADVDERTPIDHALELGQEEIVEALLKSFEDSGRPEASVISPKLLPRFADAFATAIRQNDVGKCSQIHAAGCPVDIELNEHRNLTPLIMAIAEDKSLEVVRWLLDAGASVSATMDAPYLGRYTNALEAVSENAKFNPILLELTTKYLKEGGDILGNSDTVLRSAVDAENTEGVSIILDAVRKLHHTLDTSEKPCVTSYLPGLPAFVNRQARSGPTVTALHVAAGNKDVKVVKMLVEAGADIESLDGVQKAPLHWAAATGSLDIVEHLLGCGAKVDVLNSRGETPLAMACREGNWQAATLILESSRGSSVAGGNVLHLMAFTEADRAEHSIPFFQLLLDRGADMHLLDSTGISPAHVVLVSQHAVYLRAWINRDITTLRLHQLAPWPLALFNYQYDYLSERLPFLSKNLQSLRPLMSREVTNRLLACNSPGSHSLLCWSVCSGEIEAIQPLVKLSPDVLEHQCQKHGTPLQAALIFGRDEIVKFLVGLGAQLTYDLFGRMTGGAGAIHHQPILDWLLVGRHGERAMIGNDESDHAKEVKDYAGPVLVEVPLRWEWRQSRQESMWQYACRRSQILRDLRGKVVNSVRVGEGEGEGEKRATEFYLKGVL
ncbi:hypothetical protein CkaCkLH20_05135 [Colletotrichum karsti]|uniref:Uncharacterized protein n=1 Tax=Colletotrichum karsti TaxID=1095194 RepID=A0A9P6IEY0_9PEZI|nr:uncharacterized protein CkaCkLH20_05135 [Colletotrichum karsti]KAF9877435.1 hypothetical protein CkaCkLH20_05135 [Colletotrichum karsti]